MADSWTLFVVALVALAIVAYVVWDWKRKGSP